MAAFGAIGTCYKETAAPPSWPRPRGDSNHHHQRRWPLGTGSDPAACGRDRAAVRPNHQRRAPADGQREAPTRSADEAAVHARHDETKAPDDVDCCYLRSHLCLVMEKRAEKVAAEYVRKAKHR